MVDGTVGVPLGDGCGRLQGGLVGPQEPTLHHVAGEVGGAVADHPTAAGQPATANQGGGLQVPVGGDQREDVLKDLVWKSCDGGVIIGVVGEGVRGKVGESRLWTSTQIHGHDMIIEGLVRHSSFYFQQYANEL